MSVQGPAKQAVSSAEYAGYNSADYKADYDAQGEFLCVPDFLPASVLASIQARLPALQTSVHRNFIPKHKKGGSVSRYKLNELAPEIVALYQDAGLTAWLEALCGERLLPSPESDPHGYALYYYTEPGDHIGYHYDTSYYRGKRFTVLLGIVDDSSCKLEYELHRKSKTHATIADAITLKPGTLVFFNGDEVYHRITPLGEGEQRIALTLEYVTDPRMHPWQRWVSNMKDAIAYFGFRQVFKRKQL